MQVFVYRKVPVRTNAGFVGPVMLSGPQGLRQREWLVLGPWPAAPTPRAGTDTSVIANDVTGIHGCCPSELACNNQQHHVKLIQSSFVLTSKPISLPFTHSQLNPVRPPAASLPGCWTLPSRCQVPVPDLRIGTLGTVPTYLGSSGYPHPPPAGAAFQLRLWIRLFARLLSACSCTTTANRKRPGAATFPSSRLASTQSRP